MTLRLYMDHHVRAALTKGLRRRGIDCLTTEEDGAAQWEDSMLLDRAGAVDWVLFSQDVDLLIITTDRSRRGEEFAGLIYSPQLSVTIGQAIRDLQLIASILNPADMRNRVMHIPL